jgi:hypothetical protein
MTDSDHQLRCVAIKSIDPLREIQRLLYGPNLIMLVRREYTSGIAHGYPADRHGGPGLQPGAQMDYTVRTDLSP